VVLLDNVDDVSPQLLFPGEFHSIFYMGDQDQAAHGRRELLVLVLGPGLVFDKVEGLFHFADVVVIGAHPWQGAGWREQLWPSPPPCC